MARLSWYYAVLVPTQKAEEISKVSLVLKEDFSKISHIANPFLPLPNEC
jgi:hypothetical protein